MNIESINNTIVQTPALLLYFSGDFCSVCKEIKPKLYNSIEQNYPNIEWLEINIDTHKEIGAAFEVFALPTVIVFFDGKESIRKSRNFGIDEILSQIDRPYRLFF